MFTHRVEMYLDNQHTALVLTDIQNDFLTEGGIYQGMIREGLKRNNVNANLEALLKAAKEYNFPVFVSPHYFYPHDHKWVAPLGPMEDLALKGGVAARRDPLSLENFTGSGADFPEHLRKYLQDGETTVTSPHKTYSPTNDLVLQLRRRRIDKVIMAGPVGNLCLEGHMRELITNGFEIAMVRDATAGGTNEEGDGYQAAMVNWRFMANAVWTTEEAVRRMTEAAKGFGTPSAAST